jgi:hypothetical protein
MSSFAASCAARNAFATTASGTPPLFVADASIISALSSVPA